MDIETATTELLEVWCIRAPIDVDGKETLPPHMMHAAFPPAKAFAALMEYKKRWPRDSFELRPASPVVMP